MTSKDILSFFEDFSANGMEMVESLAPEMAFYGKALGVLVLLLLILFGAFYAFFGS